VRRIPIVAVLVIVVLGLAACGRSAGSRPGDAAPAPDTAPAAAVEPASSATSPAASASAGPSPSRKSPGPSRSPSRPPESAGAPRPPVTAPGPAGALRGTGSDAVGLTFDDGPDPVNTPALLDVLKQHGIKATFCVVGFRTRDYKHVVARIAAEGHTLCNHSWQHLQDLSERPEGDLRWDLKSTNDAILAAAPGAKIKYFRAPFGNFTPRLNSYAAELGLTPIYWDVDDQCYLTAQYGTGEKMIAHMTQLVQRQTRPGSMILSHENRKPHTVTAYRTLLPWLKARYRLVALPT